MPQNKINEFSPPMMGLELDVPSHGEIGAPTDDHEAAMARADLYKLANYSFKLFKMIKDGDELEGWVQAKITKAADYIASVYHFMEYEMKFSEYGEKLERSDVYTESVRESFKQKLVEARIKLEKLRSKNISDLDENTPKKADVPAYKRKAKGDDWKTSHSDLGMDDSKKSGGKKVDVPAVTRKAKGGSWKTTQGDLDYDSEQNLSSRAGLKTRKKELGLTDSVNPKAKKDYDKDGKIESEKDEVIGSRRRAAGLDKPVKEARKAAVPPSTGMTKREKSAVAKKARAGEDIGKPGKQFAKVAAKAGGGEKGKRIAAAAMWKNQAKK